MIRRIFKGSDLNLISLFCIGSGFISIYLGQDRNWDLRNYHFYNAYSFLNSRLTFDIAPAQVQSFLNPLLDLPFYWMVTHLYPVVCGFLVGALQGLNVWLIYRITLVFLSEFSKRKSRFLSIIAATTGYYGAVNLSEIGTTFYDNITSIFVLASVVLIVSSTQKDSSRFKYPSRTRLLTAGFLLGCGAGLKLPAAIYSIAFIFGVSIMRTSWRLRLSNVVLSCLGIALGFFTTFGYWMVILWKNFQSPLFPFFNRIFQSPFYDLVNFRDERFFPRDIYQTFFYPFFFLTKPYLVNEVGFFDIRLPLCFILLTIFLITFSYRYATDTNGVKKHRSSSRDRAQGCSCSAFFITFFILSYIIWQNLFSIYRYIVPLELLAPVFIILMLQRIFSKPRFIYRTSIVLFVTIVITTAPMHWGREPWTRSYFDVKVPSLPNLDSSTIIIADGMPVSYIVPFFDENTRFVSVNNNFMRPGGSNGLHDRVRETLRNCGDDIYLLGSKKSGQDYRSILGFYYLRIDGERDEWLSTKLDDHLYLVSVSRIR